MLHENPVTRVVVVASAAFLLLVLAFAFIRSGDRPVRQVMGQEGTEDTTVPSPPDAGLQDESALPELLDLPPEPDDVLSEQYERGIPDLAVMDVRGHLNGGPPGGMAFDCPGGASQEGGSLWRCTSTGGGPAVYEVRIVGEDPRTIRSVTATAYNAPDDAAASEFLGYSAGSSSGKTTR